MKLLLDENLPHGIRTKFAGHDVYTVAFMRWDGIRNGRLLTLAGENDFDVVLTTDRGLEHQQNRSQLPCGVIILRAASNSMEDLLPLVPRVQESLSRWVARSLVVIE